jgi:hypothetical protein
MTILSIIPQKEKRKGIHHRKKEENSYIHMPCPMGRETTGVRD